MNNSVLNTFQLNSQNPPRAVLASDYDALEFEGYSLQNANIVSGIILADNAPARELITTRTPRYHGGRFLGDYFRERHVQVRGLLNYTTSTLLNAAIDDMKRQLAVSEGYLYYKVNETVRRVKATLANSEAMFSRREAYHVTYCPFDLDFVALEPFWHDLEYTAQTNESVANLAYSNNIENLGNYTSEAELTLLIEAASAVTGVTFKNNTTGEVITVTNALVAGDVLEINGADKSVKLNGTELDYSGIFPQLVYGTNSYTITTAGSSIQYTMTIKFKKSYL